MNKKVVILGAGGHAKSISNIILKSGDIVYGFLDDNIPEGTIISKSQDLKVIGKIDYANKLNEDNDVQFIIGIGNNNVRRKLAEEYNNLKYYTAIHPTSNIAYDTDIEPGTAIMANTCINVGTHIGKHAIINTGAIVEHDNIISDYAHLSPGVELSGTVTVGENTHLGTGVKVRNNISIGPNVTVGVGGVVVKNITEAGTYIGVPVREMLK